MLHQPTHPHPYLESVDVENPLGLTFSVVINPKDYVSHYWFSLCDESGTKIYSTAPEDSLNSGGWVYCGKKGTEDGTVLEHTIPYDIANSKLENGKNYYWFMSFTNSGNKWYIDTQKYYFSTKTQPIISLTSIPDTLTTCEYTFNASYTQEQNEGYMYYKFKLYRYGEFSEAILIDETPEKIDSALMYTYSSFISGNYYRLDLEIMTYDRNLYTTSKSFNVEYSTELTPLFPSVSVDKSNNCVGLDFSNNIYIQGNPNCDVTYASYTNSDSGKVITCASLPSNGALYYNKINDSISLSLGDKFTLYYRVHFEDLFVGDIIKLTNEVTGETYTVRYDGRQFFYKIGILPEVPINPYINGEKSVVHDAGSSIEDIDYDALYVLYPEDVIESDSVILYNDITANFWWTFVLLPDKVLAYKSDNYSGSVVS